MSGQEENQKYQIPFGKNLPWARLTHSYAQDGYQNFGIYDFKGNPLHQIKYFTRDYLSIIDWNEYVPIGDDFVQQTAYDALNRPVKLTQPDETELHYAYDKGGLLNFVQRNDGSPVKPCVYAKY